MHQRETDSRPEGAGHHDLGGRSSVPVRLGPARAAAPLLLSLAALLPACAAPERAVPRAAQAGENAPSEQASEPGRARSSAAGDATDRRRSGREPEAPRIEAPSEPESTSARRIELELEAEALIGSGRHLAAVRLLGEARRLATGAERERIERLIKEQMRLAVRDTRVSGDSADSDDEEAKDAEDAEAGRAGDRTAAKTGPAATSDAADGSDASGGSAETGRGRVARPETYDEEAALLERVRRTTPTERFRQAAGGHRSFLAAARAEGLTGLAAHRRAEDMQAQHRANEARLSELVELRKTVRERRGEPDFDRACRVLEEHDARPTSRELVALSEALRRQTAKILAEARLIERRSTLLLTRNGRRVPGSSLQERRPNRDERRQLERALRSSRQDALEALAVVTGATVRAALETHAATVRGRLASAFEECRRRRRELDVADLVSRIRAAAPDSGGS